MVMSLKAVSYKNCLMTVLAMFLLLLKICEQMLIFWWKE